MKTVLALLAAVIGFFSIGYFFSRQKELLAKRAGTAHADGGCGCKGAAHADGGCGCKGKSNFNSGLNMLGQHYCGSDRANLIGDDAAEGNRSVNLATGDEANGNRSSNLARNPASPAFTDAGEVQANGLVIIPEPRRSFFQPGTVIMQMPASQIVETWMGGLRAGNIVQPTMNRF